MNSYYQVLYPRYLPSSLWNHSWRVGWSVILLTAQQGALLSNHAPAVIMRLSNLALNIMMMVVNWEIVFFFYLYYFPQGRKFELTE